MDIRRQIQGFRILSWGLLSLATVITCMATAVGFLGRYWWPFELASHFRVQYFVFLLASSFIFLLKRKRRTAALVGIFAIINLSLIVPLYFGGSFAHGEERTLKAVLFNLNRSNHAYAKVRKFLRSSDPDFVVLLEVNRVWMKELQKMRADYPFSRGLARNDNFGIVLFSRIPFDTAEIQKIGAVDIPAILGRFEIDGESLTVVGAHLVPPKNPTYAEYRNGQLAELAQIVSSQKSPVIVLADLNTTSWSPFFRDLLGQTGLRDSRMGFGIQSSWPTGFPPLWITIDHCLVSPRIVVHNRRIGPHIGSDHYPVVVDFSVHPG